MKKADSIALRDKIAALFNSSRTISYEDIACKVGTSRNSVAGYVARARKAGLITRPVDPGARAANAMRARKVLAAKPVNADSYANVNLRRSTAAALRAAEKSAQERARIAAGPQPGTPMPQASDRIPGLAAEQLAIVQDSHGCLFGIGHVGAQGFHFCGDPRLMGKPYCSYHEELTHQPAKGSLAAAERMPARYLMAAE